MIDGVCIQDDQLKRLGQLKDPLYLTLDLSCQQTIEGQAIDTFHEQRLLPCFSTNLTSKKEWHLFLAGIQLYLAQKIKDNFLFTHPDWSACWISPLWPSCSAQSASPVTDQQSPV